MSDSERMFLKALILQPDLPTQIWLQDQSLISQTAKDLSDFSKNNFFYSPNTLPHQPLFRCNFLVNLVLVKHPEKLSPSKAVNLSKEHVQCGSSASLLCAHHPRLEGTASHGERGGQFSWSGCCDGQWESTSWGSGFVMQTIHWERDWVSLFKTQEIMCNFEGWDSISTKFRKFRVKVVVGTIAIPSSGNNG